METESRLQAKITNLVHETFRHMLFHSCIPLNIAIAVAFAQSLLLGRSGKPLESKALPYCWQFHFIVRYERLSIEHNKITEQRLRASSVYNSLAQVLFTELIFTAALCFGVWRVGNENPGRLGAVNSSQPMQFCPNSVGHQHALPVRTVRQHWLPFEWRQFSKAQCQRDAVHSP